MPASRLLAAGYLRHGGWGRGRKDGAAHADNVQFRNMSRLGRLLVGCKERHTNAGVRSGAGYYFAPDPALQRSGAVGHEQVESRHAGGFHLRDDLFDRRLGRDGDYGVILASRSITERTYSRRGARRDAV